MDYKIQDIFGITNKVPTTYVVRDYVDNKFTRALERQKHIVIYGCSKQGKTSLRKKYLEESNSLVIQCTNSTTREMIYQIILKEAGVELSTSQTETVDGRRKIAVSLSGEGNVFIAKAKGEGNFEHDKGKSSSITKNSFEIDPSDANDVIRILQQVNFKKWIVLEDFHYLSDSVQKYLSADLKAFYEKTDSIRMIIIGVWLESGKLTKLNGDLDGRMEYINADTWKNKELIEVLKKGEKLLNIKFSLVARDKIVLYCQNNVGLLQQIAETVCDNIGITKTQSRHLLVLNDGESDKFLIQNDSSGSVSGSDSNKPNPEILHLLARNFGINDIDEVSELNFHGGPIDKWLAELSEARAHRYTNFLREFADGPKIITSNMYRWIIYAVVKSSLQELSSGLSIKRIYEISQSIFNTKTIKGNYSILSQDIRFALHEIRNFHQEIHVSPPILDFDSTTDLLRVVDSGFLLYHSTNSVQQMLTTIGLNNEYN